MHSNPREAEHFPRVRLADLRREELHAIWLGARHCVIAGEILATDTIDRASIDWRVVAPLALQHNVCGFILANNWPSGVVVPSANDGGFTARLRVALGLFDIDLLVHFVVGDGTVAVTR